MIPAIDPRVKHVGVSYLRKLNATMLRELQGAMVICENSEPLAVIVSYETFLRIQQSTAKSLDAISGILEDNPLADRYLDAVGPRLSDGRGKVTTETRKGGRKK